VFSLRDLFRDLFTDLVKMSAEAGLRMLRDHTATELAKKNATVAGVVARVAAEAWGALIIIGNHAATAIAAAWASISAIPFVGPFLAPAVAVGTGAAVLALASGVKSAAGWLRRAVRDQPDDAAARAGDGAAGRPGEPDPRADRRRSGCWPQLRRRPHPRDRCAVLPGTSRTQSPKVFGDGVAAAIASNHSGLNKALRNRA
jgi:hypothetical protein